MKKLRLTRDDRVWLREYRKALTKQYPGSVQRFLIYGSKARGEAGPDSDLDVLLIVRDQDTKRKRELRWIGHMLAATSEALPSIFVYTEAEWEQRRRSRSPFRVAVERDAVDVR
jgi:predicted nucleotidyltransferase